MVAASWWADLQLERDPECATRFTSQVSDPWVLLVAPHGGIVAAMAVQAMATVLDDPDQHLRTVTAMFAGQVAGGPVEIDVQVLRRGRSMSQLQATVRNPGQAAGLTASAAFGRSRRGFEFTELAMPLVDPPEGLRSFRDPLPAGVEAHHAAPEVAFWNEIVDCRPAIGRAPWERFEAGPAEIAHWYRLDDPPVTSDGVLDPAALVMLCDTMPGSVGQKIGPQDERWFGPSVDLTVHVLGAASPGWLLAHKRARMAGDGYASVELALWDPSTDNGPRLVAHACQLMFFVFGVGV